MDGLLRPEERTGAGLWTVDETREKKRAKERARGSLAAALRNKPRFDCNVPASRN